LPTPVAHRIERLPAEQEAASSILARRTITQIQAPLKYFARPARSATAIRCCPAGSLATRASAGLVRNSGSTSAPGILLGLSTQPVAAGPSSIRWPYRLPAAVRVGAAS